MKKSVFQRFWDKVLVDGDGCWLWQGAVSDNGTGRFGLIRHGKWTTQVSSRVAWFLSTGKWPKKCVLHKCDVPLCMRHSHHFEGTQQDNIQDCVNKGRNAGPPKRSLCLRGHLLSGENVWNYKGRRHCRTCRNQWKRDARARGASA